MPALSRPLSRFSLTCLVALSLAGCDRSGEDRAQPQGDLREAKAGLSGTFDDSRKGALMPVVALTDPSGKTLNTGALQGQPVLINLWATWCAPCIAEMPMLDSLAQNYEGRMRVVTVSQDLRGAKVVTPFFAARDFAALQPWLDPDGAMDEAIEGAGVLPLTVMYDASGRELWRVIGGYDWDDNSARERIDAALAAS